MTDYCPFCPPAHQSIFHEGHLVVGIWDGFPVSNGHALIVTRRHIASWFDSTVEEKRELFEAVDIAKNILLQ